MRAACALLCRIVAVAAALMLAVMAFCLGSYAVDQHRLATIANEVTTTARTKEERVIALMDWVYANQGFKKNSGSFLFPGRGPTPIDVLEHGGDCADKSRLLVAMLRELQIRSTPAMCFDPTSGAPTHTVVEAEVGEGRYMVADPIWDLSFPKPDGQGYYDLVELRKDPEILWHRLAEVTATAAPDAKIRHYNRAGDIYDRASTFNWDKDDRTRAAREVLRRWLGDGVYRLFRPLVIEDPKLFAAALFGGIGAGGCVLAIGLGWLGRRVE